METRFVKIENNYINTINIERFVTAADGIYLFTVSGNKFRLTSKTTKDDIFAMKRILRKINEKAYDIIFLEEFIENDEAFK